MIYIYFHASVSRENLLTLDPLAPHVSVWGCDDVAATYRAFDGRRSSSVINLSRVLGEWDTPDPEAQVMITHWRAAAGGNAFDRGWQLKGLLLRFDWEETVVRFIGEFFVCVLVQKQRCWRKMLPEHRPALVLPGICHGMKMYGARRLDHSPSPKEN